MVVVQSFGRPGSAGIFPLCFGRQGIFVSRRQTSRRLLPFCQLLAKLQRLIPAYIINGETISRSMFTAIEFVRFASHHSFILRLGHFVLAYPVFPRQGHLMLGFIILSAQLARRTSHRERIRIDPDHFQVHIIRQRDGDIPALGQHHTETALRASMTGLIMTTGC